MNKNNLLALLLLPLVLLVSCTNLDDINRRLDEHESRLQSLESLVKNANTSINNLQKLLDAHSQQLTISSYTPLDDGTGYVLVMSDGSSITLKNGNDGTSPNIGVTEFEGVLYWTIDGKFILDANGMKIKAEGKNGTSGVTPKLRVNTDGYWEVSIDNGKSWTLVKDTNGNSVKAVGSDASVDLTITEDDDNITIVYEGKTFVIPKKKGETPAPVKRPILAIDYVADYNVNSDGTGFTTSHANNMSGYFNWNDAMAKFGIDKEFTVNGQTYHIPSQDEWCGIVPEYNGGKNIRFDTPTTTLNYTEKISIGGAPVKTYKSDYKYNR
ncbi:PL29 family lyase N-terminal domain-containing protein [Porphyromonadaceae bacterium W3.11]|nr:PL29 family lyase N-terminal domain-containing protein [Porphyromonadaceae bacterium W3.11]